MVKECIGGALRVLRSIGMPIIYGVLQKAQDGLHHLLAHMRAVLLTVSLPASTTWIPRSPYLGSASDPLVPSVAA